MYQRAMALVRSSTRVAEGEGLAASNNSASWLLKSAANQMAEKAVPMLARMNFGEVLFLSNHHISDLVLGLTKCIEGC